MLLNVFNGFLMGIEQFEGRIERQGENRAKYTPNGATGSRGCEKRNTLVSWCCGAIRQNGEFGLASQYRHAAINLTIRNQVITFESSDCFGRMSTHFLRFSPPIHL